MSYKYQRVRERLRQAVVEGELAGKLPGERELARRYSANAKTINKALTDLATEGLLVRHVGRGTFVADHAQSSDSSTSPGKPRLFGYLVDAGASEARSKMLFERTAELIHGRGHRMEQLILAADPGGELSGRGLRADRLRNFEGLVLCSLRPSDDLLADISRRHIPLVMVANHHPSIRTAAVLPDYAQGAFELCQHLIQLGHTQIRLVMAAPFLPAAQTAESGYQAAMQRYGLASQATVGPDDQPVDRILQQPDVNKATTAVICVGSATAGLFSQASRAISPDRALSICCLPEPGDPAAAEHHLTAYEIDPRQVAHWTTELLVSASPARWQRVAIVPGHLAVRGSTRRPEHPATVNPPREMMK